MQELLGRSLGGPSTGLAVTVVKTRLVWVPRK